MAMENNETARAKEILQINHATVELLRKTKRAQLVADNLK